MRLKGGDYTLLTDETASLSYQPAFDKIASPGAFPWFNKIILYKLELCIA
jgi:hypothetical protein